MEKLVSRVTVVQRGTDKPQVVTVYKKPSKKKKPDSIVTKPLERLARRLIKAEIAFGQSLLEQHDESKKRRKNGWLLEAPANISEASKKAYNEARKSVPFRLLPKA
jgi:hypothetical protein